MHLEIITPDKQAYSGQVDGVKVPGAKGSFEILNGHAAIISSLTQGEVRISTKGKSDETLKIDSGIVEMLNNKITILAESILED